MSLAFGAELFAELLPLLSAVVWILVVDLRSSMIKLLEAILPLFHHIDTARLFLAIFAVQLLSPARLRVELPLKMLIKPVLERSVILTMMRIVKALAMALFLKIVCMLGLVPWVLCLLANVAFVALVLKLATDVLLFFFSLVRTSAAAAFSFMEHPPAPQDEADAPESDPTILDTIDEDVSSCLKVVDPLSDENKACYMTFLDGKKAKPQSAPRHVPKSPGPLPLPPVLLRLDDLCVCCCCSCDAKIEVVVDVDDDDGTSEEILLIEPPASSLKLEVVIDDDGDDD
jgi:hypothetical protein